VDRFKLDADGAKRLTQSLDEAFGLAEDTCLILIEGKPGAKPKEILFSRKRSCPNCHISYEEFTPNMFSFNSPYGACGKCRGLGRVSQLVEKYLIVDASKALLRGALNPEINFSFNKKTGYWAVILSQRS